METNSRSDSSNQHESIGVAIVGMAGRFPGAESASEFWDNLAAGKSGISDVGPRSNRDSVLPGHPNYVSKCAVVPDADRFDAKFFGVYPKQAIDMDPQHRLFLETCWLAMEDAGYRPDGTTDRVGVFAGCHMNTYIFARLAKDEALRNSLADSYPGGSLTAEISNDKDYLATRVAYQLNLRGPCVAVQSACSTSLVAIAQACESIESGACLMAIAGGATITFPQKQGYLHTEDSILSPDGVCRTFDANAKGTIFGDGVGAVILKRVDHAIADRDHIYAVIRGWGVNNDGRDKAGYTAPSVEGQSQAIRLAHRKAHISAETIDYVEAHGTGTLVGDPIEVEALTRAFRETTPKKQFCRIGSLKSNVGHLDVAAGVSSVIKTALSLKNRLIPPTLNFQTANPRIDFENSPFVVNTQLTPWDSGESPRRAGVSSFGVGGTNAHLVLEEAPVTKGYASRRPDHLVVLSAKSEKALDEVTDDFVDHFGSESSSDIADVCHTLQVGRAEMKYRRTVVASNAQEAAEKLKSKKPNSVWTGVSQTKAKPIVFMFPGQGSQHVDMGWDLYRTEPMFAKHLDEAARHLLDLIGADLRTLVFSDYGADGSGRLDQTEIAQPALFAFSYAMAKWWQTKGIQPDVLVGHSVGEFAAAAVAGVMSLSDAARLVATRGRLMQSLPPGSMLAVQLPEAKLRGMLPDRLEIAAINGPEFCVVSGPSNRIAQFSQELEAGRYGQDLAFRPLRTSHAFHSWMMDPAVSSFSEVVSQIELNSPETAIVSSVTANLLNDALAKDIDYWATQIREPVRFSDTLEHVLQDDATLLEVGPGQALSTLARQQNLDKTRHHVLSSMPHAKQNVSSAKHAFETLGRLWVEGVKVDWGSVYHNEQRRRVSLPTYRFQRESYWFSDELHSASQKSPQEACDTECHSQVPPTSVDVSTLPGDTGQHQAANRLIQQQMEMMNHQLQLLKRQR